MQAEVGDIIDLARMWAQDDMNDNKGAILKPARWLQQFNILYKKLYKQWLREGLITPSPFDQEFAGPETRIGGWSPLPAGNLQSSPGIVAVQGVARGTITGYRGAEVDLSEWFADCPRLVFQIKQTAGRPTFEAAQGIFAATFVNVDGAFRLEIEAGVTTYGDLVTLVGAMSDVELLFYTPGLDATVLGSPIAAGPYPVKGGEVLMSEVRCLQAAQQAHAKRKPFYTTYDSPAVKWHAFSEYSSVRVRLQPSDTEQYVVRYYELPREVTSQLEYVVLPDNGVDLLSMQLAERAMMTEGGASKKLQEFIIDAKAEQAFTSMALLRTKLLPHEREAGWPLNPTYWTFF